MAVDVVVGLDLLQGAGKTTLLNHILAENHGKRIAVIENEFGEVIILLLTFLDCPESGWRSRECKNLVQNKVILPK